MTHITSPIRPSPIAGTWYPGEAEHLRKEVRRYLDQAVLPSIEGDVVAVISPHAGYRYSGPTAGYSYRSVEGKSYDLCVIVSPLHIYLPAALLTSAHQAYSTPLGQVEIDRHELDNLQHEFFKASGDSLTSIANDNEHSLEIQLPFLQVALASPFKLLPVMVRSENPHQLKLLGESIARVIRGKNALLVASTDLSHFYSENEANLLDKNMLNQILDFSPEGVLEAESRGSGFACGAGAVAVVLWAAHDLGANKVTLLHHTTSAEETHDKTNVVGYGAAVITR